MFLFLVLLKEMRTRGESESSYVTVHLVVFVFR